MTGYRVERCQGAGCTTFAQVAAPAGTSYSDTGLVAATTYRYQVRAIDGAGNLGPYSAVAEATTPDTVAPGAPGAVTATAASETAIDVSWGPATDNVGVTGYRVERCQGAACTTFAQVAAPSGTAFSDTGLASGTTYRYRVRAEDAAGNLGPYTSAASAATLDLQAPTAPGTLAASAVNGSQVGLTWSAATDNVAVTGYRVERCQGSGCATFVQVGAPTGTTYTDTGLASGATYAYRVRAADAAGNLGPYSNVAEATTPATPPGLVAAYSFDAGSGTTLADVSGDGNAGTIVGATWTTAGKYGNALSFNGATSYVDLGNPADLQLTGSMTWSAWVYATGTPADDGQIIAKSADGGGTVGWQFKTSPDTGPRTFGIGVSSNGTAITQRYSATLPALGTWYYVAGVYDATARTLDIYVNGVLDNGVLSGTVPASQFSPAENVTIGRRTGGYYFQGTIDELRIYDRALTSSEIQADMNTPLGVAAADTQPPTGPATLSALASSGNSVDLSWSAATDNVAVTAYHVERCQGAGCTSFAEIATTSATAYQDVGLTANTSYRYRVRAADAAGNLGLYSPVADVTTPEPDTLPPSAPGTLTAVTANGEQIRPELGGGDRQQGRHGISDRAVPGQRVRDVRPGGNGRRDHRRRHGADARHDLRLPGTGDGRGREPGAVTRTWPRRRR